MGTFVVDASVIVKWLLADPENEADTERATALITVARAHWFAEE